MCRQITEDFISVREPRSVARYSEWLQAVRSGDRIPVGDEIFRTCPDRPWGPFSLLYNGYRVFPWGKERPGCDADPSPPSSAVVKKGQSYTFNPPMGRTACTEPQCLYKGALYLYRLFPFARARARARAHTHPHPHPHTHMHYMYNGEANRCCSETFTLNRFRKQKTWVAYNKITSLSNQQIG